MILYDLLTSIIWSKKASFESNLTPRPLKESNLYKLERLLAFLIHCIIVCIT